MKKVIYTIPLIFLCLSTQAQQNTVSSGGEANGTGGSASFSVGQIDYINNATTSGSMHQGVQQPFEFFHDLSVDNASLIDISLFPNPTNELVIMKLESFISDLNYILYDNKGKSILNGKIVENETALDMSLCAAGEYHLSLFRDQEKFQSFKIIKY